MTAPNPSSIQQQRALAIGALVVLAVLSLLLSGQFVVARAGLTIAGLVLAVAGVMASGPGGAVAVVAAGLELLMIARAPWQVAMLGAMGLLHLVARQKPDLSSVLVPWGRFLAWPTVGCGAITPIFLLVWVSWLHPDLSDIVRAVPNLGLPWLLLGGVVFAVVNSLLEEWVWRGVFQDRLSLLFPGAVAIGLQAASFGLAHAHGFPRGALGVIGAGVWAVLLGMLRARSRGLLSPFAAHFVADLTIALLVIFRLR